MRWTGRGHPAIRATHTKTIELAADLDITARATCVVAVAGQPDDARRIAGAVHIAIAVGDVSFGFDARANSSWDPAAGSAVIRRSPLRLPATLATHATAAAADLPRALVAALADPHATVEVTVRPRPGPATAVLFAFDPLRPDPALAAELAAADLVVAEDEVAARAVGARLSAGPVDVAGRVLVVAARELPGGTVTDALDAVDIETVGLAPALAVAAAAPTRGPILLAPPGAQLRDLLARAPAHARVVVAVPARRLPDLLAQAEKLLGARTAVAAVEYAPPVRIDAATVGERFPGGDDVVHVCLSGSVRDDSLDATVRAAVAGLLADGVPTKTAAKALAELTGWPRKRAYDAIVNWPPS